MATIAFLSAFNLDDLELWQGTITDIGAASITVQRGDDTAIFRGPLGLNTNTEITGVITGIDYLADNALLFLVSQISFDAPDFFDYVDAEDAEGLLRDLLSGADVITGSDGSDQLYSGQGADTLSGRRGNDVLEGQQGADFLFGGQGKDVLIGGRGADDLSGDAGGDRLFGLEGADFADGGRGRDLLQGGSGEDDLRGGAGRDTVRGGLDADTLDGGAGRDFLSGGRGRDILTGGAGVDGFEFARGERGDRITDFIPGVDFLNFEGVANPNAVTIAAVAGGAKVSAGDMSVVLEGVAADEVNGNILFLLA